MESTIVVAIISASAGVVVAVIGAAISFYLTRKKDREAEWRKHKIEHYKELLLGISGIVGTDATPEGQLRFARACNTIVLVASPTVVQALEVFKDESRISNTGKSSEKHDKALRDLLLAVRQDIKLPSKDDPANFHFRLWCSGVSEEMIKQLTETAKPKEKVQSSH